MGHCASPSKLPPSPLSKKSTPQLTYSSIPPSQCNLHRVGVGEKPTVTGLLSEFFVGTLSLPLQSLTPASVSSRLLFLLGAAAELVEIFPEGYGYQLC